MSSFVLCTSYRNQFTQEKKIIAQVIDKEGKNYDKMLSKQDIPTVVYGKVININRKI